MRQSLPIDDEPQAPRFADDNTIPFELPPRAPRQRHRVRRFLLILLTLVILLLVLPTGVAVMAYEQPRLVHPLTSLILPVQPGAIPWNGTDRITILAMGVDQRTTEPPHSDTMMLISLDPVSRHVNMLSLPRDLWVNLPESSAAKINSAITIGGPRYAAFAVDSALGVPVNYYAVLKFTGYRDLVDALGGVTVDVKTAISDPTYPADVGYGFDPLYIPAGVQHMNGTTALKYVRTRHDDPQGDIGRNDRQQQVLMALKQQALTPGTLVRLPAVLAALRNAVNTDIPYDRLPDVAAILGHAHGASLTSTGLTPQDGDVSVGTSWDGQWIFVPNWTSINAKTQRLFSDPQLTADHARVDVENGTTTTGLAAILGATLTSDGFTVADVQQADRSDYATTEVIVHDPSVAYSGRALASMLHASLQQDSTAPVRATSPQITVIIGANFPGASTGQ